VPSAAPLRIETEQLVLLIDYDGVSHGYLDISAPRNKTNVSGGWHGHRPGEMAKGSEVLLSCNNSTDSVLQFQMECGDQKFIDIQIEWEERQD
jgi:hypothetical protein